MRPSPGDLHEAGPAPWAPSRSGLTRRTWAGRSPVARRRGTAEPSGFVEPAGSVQPADRSDGGSRYGVRSVAYRSRECNARPPVLWLSSVGSILTEPAERPSLGCTGSSPTLRGATAQHRTGNEITSIGATGTMTWPGGTAENQTTRRKGAHRRPALPWRRTTDAARGRRPRRRARVAFGATVRRALLRGVVDYSRTTCQTASGETSDSRYAFGRRPPWRSRQCWPSPC